MLLVLDSWFSLSLSEFLKQKVHIVYLLVSGRYGIGRLAEYRKNKQAVFALDVGAAASAASSGSNS